MPRPDWVEVGVIAKPHGVRGEVRVVSSSDNPERFVAGAVLYARSIRDDTRFASRRGERLPVEVRPMPPQGDCLPPDVDRLFNVGDRLPLTIDSVRGPEENPIVAFVGVVDRDQADGLRGFVLEVPVEDLPELEEGEFWAFDLEELEVRTPDGRRIGQVVELLESPVHDLLLIRLDSGRDLLLPFVEQTTPEVRIDEGYLVVDDGLLTAEDAGA